MGIFFYASPDYPLYPNYNSPTFNLDQEKFDQDVKKFLEKEDLQDIKKKLLQLKLIKRKSSISSVNLQNINDLNGKIVVLDSKYLNQSLHYNVLTTILNFTNQIGKYIFVYDKNELYPAWIEHDRLKIAKNPLSLKSKYYEWLKTIANNNGITINRIVFYALFFMLSLIFSYIMHALGYTYLHSLILAACIIIPTILALLLGYNYNKSDYYQKLLKTHLNLECDDKADNVLCDSSNKSFNLYGHLFTIKVTVHCKNLIDNKTTHTEIRQKLSKASGIDEKYFLIILYNATYITSTNNSDLLVFYDYDKKNFESTQLDTKCFEPEKMLFFDKEEDKFLKVMLKDGKYHCDGNIDYLRHLAPNSLEKLGIAMSVISCLAAAFVSIFMGFSLIFNIAAIIFFNFIGYLLAFTMLFIAATLCVLIIGICMQSSAKANSWNKTEEKTSVNNLNQLQTNNNEGDGIELKELNQKLQPSINNLQKLQN